MRFFIEDSVDVSCPFEAVRGRFVSDSTWFAPLASAAEGEGEALYLRIGLSWASGRVQREVRVTHGPPRDLGVAVVVPVSWQSSGLPALFPVLEGEVELLPLNPDRCRVSLFAFYEPPFGQRTSVDGLWRRASREIEPQPHISHVSRAGAAQGTSAMPVCSNGA